MLLSRNPVPLLISWLRIFRKPADPKTNIFLFHSKRSFINDIFPVKINSTSGMLVEGVRLSLCLWHPHRIRNSLSLSLPDSLCWFPIPVDIYSLRVWMCNDSSYKLNSFLTASQQSSCMLRHPDRFRQRRTAYSLVDQECAHTQTFTLILRAKGYDHQQQHPSTISHLLAAGRHYEDDYKDDEMIPRRVTLSSSPQDDGNWIFTKLALCHPRLAPPLIHTSRLLLSFSARTVMCDVLRIISISKTVRDGLRLLYEHHHMSITQTVRRERKRDREKDKNSTRGVSVALSIHKCIELVILAGPSTPLTSTSTSQFDLVPQKQ